MGRIRAGALQFVLFIGAVIAVLLLAFILLSYTHARFAKSADRFVHTLQSADLGVAYVLKSNIRPGDTLELDTGLENGATLMGIKEYWGVFEKYGVVATANKHRFTRVALAGGGVGPIAPVLYLQDNERPLIIVGTAKINGDALLPKQGIRPGNISGRSYYHPRLVYGRQGTSTATLPKLEAGHLDYLKRLLVPQGSVSALEELPLVRLTEIKNSFKQPTQFIRGSVLDLSETSLTGNIVVWAAQKIRVDASSQLTDVLLVAPEIEIGPGVKGNFQALASKRINVGSGCELFYPSALTVIETAPIKKENTLGEPPNIYVAPGAQIRGALLYLGDGKTQRFSPQIKVDTDAHITGQIHCAANLELKGNLTGHLSTHSFIALENGSIYQNHLYNGTMDNSRLPLQFAGLTFEDTATKSLGKWLY